ncbi:MAG: hypothetical protein UX60_C0020G0003 [Berkelbacteria bacterium GW2011_GWA2_46_7]|uniref:HTH cro/C1-type domain-containing protein n=1 Tax=Berkelbacteria bacterium GW2011_GWA2_46_7 TaxID=1618335 RepID=A0A0G1TDZ2_9BACT|nr:MAG: hypothetical protein UX60_C0020G0003 [Berkelbacteria bacterium GW2011_GWA2_46_7]
MDISEGLTTVFDMMGKDFYAPLFGDSKRTHRRKSIKHIKADPLIPAYIHELQRLRLLTGIRQQTVAREMKSSQSSISRFEMGRVNPTVNFIVRYCEIVGVEVGIVFKETKGK